MALAYGFTGIEHLLADRVANTNIAVVRDAITSSVAEHNRVVAGIMSELAVKTTDYSTRFRQSAGGTLQPLDDMGNPIVTRGGTSYDVAFPIQGGGTAWGDNRVSRAMMTVEEVSEYTLNAMRQDGDWIKRHVLAALLDKATWTFPDDDHGDLTIQPLANGGVATYTKKNGTEATDNHYIAQSAAISDGATTNPFPTIYDELNEHPENAGAEMVSYIPTNVKTAVTGLTNFVEVSDSAINYGSGTSTLKSVVDRGFGDELLGKVDGMWIVEWSALPDDYVLSVARGGVPVLKMREYDAPALQGFFEEEADTDGNLKEHRFIRYAGFGVYNRVGAVAYFIEAGDTTYDTPSAYNSPLAV